MIAINIDGKECVTVNGLTIIDAARSHGIDIPALGYDPRVSPPSNFEASFVEVTEGVKTRFVSATSTQVADDMVIRTQSEALQSYRRSHDLRQSRRLVNVNRSKRSDYEPPEGGYSPNILS